MRFTRTLGLICLTDVLSDARMMAPHGCTTSVLHEAAYCPAFAGLRKRMPGAAPILKSYFAYCPNYGVYSRTDRIS
jgi:hypothetical protein